MSWDSFSTFFQLAAAFTLTYAVIESFTAYMNENILKIGNYFLGNDLNEKEKEKYAHYREYINSLSFPKNKNNKEVKIDPLGLALNELIKRNKQFFFHAFIVCCLFILLAGFENFFQDINGRIPLSIHQKFFGLIIFSFSSIWIYLLIIFCFAFNSFIKDKAQIEKELIGINTIKFKRTLTHLNLVFSIHSVWSAYLLGGILVLVCYGLGINESSLQGHICCPLLIICIFSIFIPFIFQFKAMKVTENRYIEVAKMLNEKKGGGSGKAPSDDEKLNDQLNDSIIGLADED